MSPLTLAATIAGLGAVTVLFLLRRKAWAISAGAVLMVLLGLVTIDISRALAIKGPPPPPFVLWYGSGDQAWVSPDRYSSRRTYDWKVPDDMMRALREGKALKVEGKGGDGGRPGSGDSPGEYRWTPLEPENSLKQVVD